MIEFRRLLDLDHWWHVSSNVVPTTNLTPKEIKLINDRDDLLNLLSNFKDNAWFKINTGIFKGSIFPAVIDGFDDNSDDQGPAFSIAIEPRNDIRMAGSGAPGLVVRKKYDQPKGWTWTKQAAWIHASSGNLPIVFKEATIYPEFFGSDVEKNLSILFNYQGDRVFKINEKVRPLTFIDRLNQEVTIGDLVVVALNYGAGLDVCMVKGFADERRVVIESMETGERDRIALENNSTKKIMRMPNSLRDTAMLLKLSR
jgi:hypothetical protein